METEEPPDSLPRRRVQQGDELVIVARVGQGVEVFVDKPDPGVRESWLENPSVSRRERGEAFRVVGCLPVVMEPSPGVDEMVSESDRSHELKRFPDAVEREDELARRKGQ